MICLSKLMSSLNNEESLEQRHGMLFAEVPGPNSAQMRFLCCVDGLGVESESESSFLVEVSSFPSSIGRVTQKCSHTCQFFFAGFVLGHMSLIGDMEGF